jgi:hypothetical protein
MRWEELPELDYVYLRPSIAFYSYNLEIRSENGKSVEWKPSGAITLGSDVSLKGYPGFGFSYTFPGADEDLYGKTLRYDYRFNLQLRDRFYFQLDAQYYRGFYTDDSADPLKPGHPFRDASLRLTNFRLRNIYVFSPQKFSLLALRAQTQRQTKSGGSLLSGFSLGYGETSSSSGLVPSTLQSSFGEDAQLKKFWSLALLARIGYGYTWVMYPKFFWGAYLLVGLGPEQVHLNYFGSQSAKNRMKLGVGANFFTAMGYTGDKFTTSLSLDTQSNSFPGSSSSLGHTLYATNLNFGWRF